MHGPGILVRSLSRRTVPDAFGNSWQYHSRSDHHSKVACWAVLFDLLLSCASLVAQAESGEVVFGINHEMRDFKQDRKKDLDLVVCTPRVPYAVTTFKALAAKWDIVLTPEEAKCLRGLPDLELREVGSVRIALEAKACMTAHIKALPRFFDELNSSHHTIHGASAEALAVGFAMVNGADTFVSPDRNKHKLGKQNVNVSDHKQPGWAARAIEKAKQLPRRTRVGEDGFDALGIVVVDCRNDGSPVSLVSSAPAPPPGDIYHYESMIRRVAQLYETRFGRG